MKTTVCIPTTLFNLNYLLDLINSIEFQSVLPDKVLIIASGRPIHEINKDLEALKERISTKLSYEFITSEIKGLGIARNYGIDLCKTEILIFGDDDDIWHKDRIKEIKSIVENNNPCLVKHYHNTLENNRINPVPWKYKSKPNPFNVGFSNLIGGGSAIAGSLSIFKIIKFADYKYCEDWDFWIRSYLAGIKIIQIEKELVTYRIHSRRMTKSFKGVYALENVIRFKYFFGFLFFTLGIILGFLKSTIVLSIRLIYFSVKGIF